MAIASRRDTAQVAACVLIVLCVAALGLRFGVALQSPSLDHPDEIFQTLEPAHRLAFGYGVVTWEWRDGVRSWILPALLAGVMRATSWMGPGSSGYLLAIALVLSLLSLTTVWFAYAWGNCASGDVAGITAAAACALWWELIFFGPKALNEVVAGNVLLIGLYLGKYGGGLPEARRMFLAGLCWGLAAALRIHLAAPVFLATLYFCWAGGRRTVAPLAMGVFVPFAVFGTVDALTWSYPFQSFLRYFAVNILEGRARRYGTEPWHWYWYVLLKHFGPLLALAVLGARRSPFLGWMAFVTVATHSLISHKENRFIYPAVPMVITLAALGFTELAAKVNARLGSRLSPKAVIAAGVVICALTSGVFAYHFPYWKESSGGQIALKRLSRDPTVCGVALYSVHWPQTGGYAHLHQHVPIVLAHARADLDQPAPSFNALVTAETARPDIPAHFELDACSRGVCVLRRAGPCYTVPWKDEINEALRQAGL